jgi:hypothetical protein
MIRARIVPQQRRILDLDIENRPLSYLGGDWTTAEITTIAAGWSDEKKVHCWALGEDDPAEMLWKFRELYDEADLVTGHYVRKHDLPILNGAYLEYHLPPLGAKWASDTCLDLTRRKDLSRSQEALAGMYGLPESKHHMSQPEWREANRLTPAGVAYAKKRVTDDVVQHKALRQRLIEAEALKGPKMWRP